MEVILPFPGINPRETPLLLHVLQDWTDLVVKLSNDLSNETVNINKNKGLRYEEWISNPILSATFILING